MSSQQHPPYDPPRRPLRVHVSVRGQLGDGSAIVATAAAHPGAGRAGVSTRRQRGRTARMAGRCPMLTTPATNPGRDTPLAARAWRPT